MLGPILLLDDEPVLLDVMEEIIRALCSRDSIKVTSLLQLKEKEAEALSAEMAFLDINLGPKEPSGLEAYEWLRKNGFKGPIFFFTGHARGHPLIDQASKLGDVKVLSKPIEVDRFIQIIETGKL